MNANDFIVNFVLLRDCAHCIDISRGLRQEEVVLERVSFWQRKFILVAPHLVLWMGTMYNKHTIVSWLEWPLTVGWWKVYYSIVSQVVHNPNVICQLLRIMRDGCRPILKPLLWLPSMPLPFLWLSHQRLYFAAIFVHQIVIRPFRVQAAMKEPPSSWRQTGVARVVAWTPQDTVSLNAILLAVYLRRHRRDCGARRTLTRLCSPSCLWCSDLLRGTCRCHVLVVLSPHL